MKTSLKGHAWVFGDNVEDVLGHVGYTLFYLGCGGAAASRS